MGGMGEVGSIAFPALSKMRVIQAETNRSLSFLGFIYLFVLTAAGRISSQSAIGESKAKIQQEQRREERILSLFEFLCLGSKNPRSCALSFCPSSLRDSTVSPQHILFQYNYLHLFESGKYLNENSSIF